MANKNPKPPTPSKPRKTSGHSVKSIMFTCKPMQMICECAISWEAPNPEQLYSMYKEHRSTKGLPSIPKNADSSVSPTALFGNNTYPVRYMK